MQMTLGSGEIQLKMKQIFVGADETKFNKKIFQVLKFYPKYFSFPIFKISLFNRGLRNSAIKGEVCCR